MTVTKAQGLEDLKEVIESYNALAGRLQESQRALQREVLLLRRELVEKNRQLAQKNRLAVLGEMAAGVAHEIRNPLGGIELCAGLIAREAGGDEKIGRWARRIVGATQDLGRIVGDILDFTRPITPRLREVALSEVAEGALDLASLGIEAKGIVVECARRRGERKAAADFQLLQRAFLNVILNAVDAMEAGGALKIRTFEAEVDGAAAEGISFEDSGCGIDAGDIEKVFDPFFTRKEGGTGLGLAMVSRIVAAHGGRITAANSARGGAVFTIVLMCVGAAAGERVQ